MSSQFQVYFSVIYPIDEKRGTKRFLYAVVEEKVKVVKYDANFMLEVCTCVRNLYLGLGIRV